MGCKACEAKINGDEGWTRPHSGECRARLEEAMQQDDVETEILVRRDARKARGMHEGEFQPAGGGSSSNHQKAQPEAEQTEDKEKDDVLHFGIEEKIYKTKQLLNYLYCNT